MTTKQVLEDALTRLRTEGWTQRTYAEPDGQACMIGAIEGIRYGQSHPWLNPSFVAAREAVRDVINEQYPESGYCNIPDFNDDSKRTFAEVEAVFEKAIAKADDV